MPYKFDELAQVYMDLAATSGLTIEQVIAIDANIIAFAQTEATNSVAIELADFENNSNYARNEDEKARKDMQKMALQRRKFGRFKYATCCS